MKKSMRKGFTLVELLIVIVVIGILSAMMMLSSTEAVTSAKAADIISDLRNLKTAALAYYADNLDEVEAGVDITTDAVRKKIVKYMGAEVPSQYKFTKGLNINSEWYVTCDFSDDKVAAKLDSRKTTVGLTDKAVSSDTSTITKYNGGVHMFIR